MEYTAWNLNDLGISFYSSSGRITIYKATLAILGYPDNFRFLLDSENKQLAIEVCSFESAGSHQLRKIPVGQTVDVYSKDMVRFIFQTCNWTLKSTYKAKGIAMPNYKMVVFDLKYAEQLSSV